MMPQVHAGGPWGRLNKEAVMQWKTPKIVEIACGCEINAYFPADL
jgi:coenzyme PQQ precursor peptide PqqA